MVSLTVPFGTYNQISPTSFRRATIPSGVEKAKSASPTTFINAQASSFKSFTGFTHAVMSFCNNRNERTSNSCAAKPQLIKQNNIAINLLSITPN